MRDMAASELVPAAWMTTPAARKRTALNAPCEMRWKTAATAVGDGEGAGHVAELADRRVGEDALDVVLGEGGEPGARSS
ncbi:hypothetical protein SGLAM104S_08166 [Streptomyces glaucescens]